jgi:excisionase family DNA binding protein
MHTLSLREAAQFLRIHPEELRQRAKAGRIPGAKVGRAWVFVEEDLASYLRSLYGSPRQALQVTPSKEVKCHYADAVVNGGSTSSPHPGDEYAALLGLPIESSRRNTTTG